MITMNQTTTAVRRPSRPTLAALLPLVWSWAPVVACQREPEASLATEASQALVTPPVLPADVRCLVLGVQGKTPTERGERAVDVREDRPASFSWAQLPQGTVIVTGAIYEGPCARRTKNARPIWSGAPVGATVLPGKATKVVLTLRRYLPGLVMEVVLDVRHPGGIVVTHRPRGPRLWGWSDLHAHPASHLAFGKSESATGIFWGKPGLALADAAASIEGDLAPCSPDKHHGFDEDLARHLLRTEIMTMMNGLTGHTHTASGYPYFATWPDARSLQHQQMHITWIRRAYDGGLRLMIASATDNQLLSRGWNVGLGDLLGGLIGGGVAVAPEARFDVESARAQLAFIRELAAANADWMQIVRSPREARAAVAANKLAIILSLELDALTEDQIDELVAEHEVRHVIPIHLADNDFGGTAVYEDFFNLNTAFLRGRPLSVVGDPLVGFRLGRPPLLTPSYAAYCATLYEPCPEVAGGISWSLGHRNMRGLSRDDVLAGLMRSGMLVDVVHMSQAAIEGTVGIAENSAFPVMNSHTDLRGDGVPGRHERDMLAGHARRIAALGGVMGLGTEGSYAPETIFLKQGPEALILAGDDSRRWSLIESDGGSDPLAVDPVVDRLRFKVGTGGDDMDGGEYRVYATVELRDGRSFEHQLNRGDVRWSDRTVAEVEVPLPDGVRARDITRITMHTTGPFLSLSAPSWTLTSLHVDAHSVAGDWVSLVSDEVGVAFGSDRDWAPVYQGRIIATAGSAEVLEVLVRTGSDDLRSDQLANVRFQLWDGRIFTTGLNRGASWGKRSVYRTIARLPAGTRVADLAAVYVDKSRVSWGPDGQDDWKVDELRVDRLADPVATWRDRLVQAQLEMGGSGVALGTDINGLAAQVAFSQRSVTYPINVASSRAPAALGVASLGQLVSGRRRFDVMSDGIANYGLLPDFLAAVAQLPDGAEPIDRLFGSTEDVIRMWEHVEDVGRRLRGLTPETPVQNVRINVRSGADGLEDGDQLRAYLLADGASVAMALGEDELAPWATRGFGRSLDPPIALGSLHTFSVELLGGRSWDVASLALEFQAPDGHWEALVDVRATPYFFQLSSGDNRWDTLLR
jgi:microsomal dipeptidase-like Zn-dependent dipeptidase